MSDQGARCAVNRSTLGLWWGRVAVRDCESKKRKEMRCACVSGMLIWNQYRRRSISVKFVSTQTGEPLSWFIVESHMSDDMASIGGIDVLGWVSGRMHCSAVRSAAAARDVGWRRLGDSVYSKAMSAWPSQVWSCIPRASEGPFTELVQCLWLLHCRHRCPPSR